MQLDLNMVVKPDPLASHPEDTWAKRISPLLDVIFVERLTIGPDEKIGSYYVPDSAISPTGVARVFAVSAGIPDTRCTHYKAPCRIPISVSVGDFVIFPAMAGRDLVWEEEGNTHEYTALVEGEILGTINYGKLA